MVGFLLISSLSSSRAPPRNELRWCCGVKELFRKDNHRSITKLILLLFLYGDGPLKLFVGQE